MLRTLAAALAGAIVLCVSNALYWGPIGLHAVGTIATGAPGLTASREDGLDAGANVFPGLPSVDVTEAELRDFEERHRRGPIGMLIVHPPGGGESFAPLTAAVGFAITLVTSAL